MDHLLKTLKEIESNLEKIKKEQEKSLEELNGREHNN